MAEYNCPTPVRCCFLKSASVRRTWSPEMLLSCLLGFCTHFGQLFPLDTLQISLENKPKDQLYMILSPIQSVSPHSGTLLDAPGTSFIQCYFSTFETLSFNFLSPHHFVSTQDVLKYGSSTLIFIFFQVM